MNEIICLDVGGDRYVHVRAIAHVMRIGIPRMLLSCLRSIRYHVRRGCLTRLPNTRLGRLARCASQEDAREFCDIPYDHSPKEYFFDRNGDNFSSILGKNRTEQNRTKCVFRDCMRLCPFSSRRKISTKVLHDRKILERTSDLFSLQEKKSQRTKLDPRKSRFSIPACAKNRYTIDVRMCFYCYYTRCPSTDWD